MRRPLMLLAALLAGLLIAGCGGSGHSADPPAAGLTLVAGDGVITASWAPAAGVEYWLFFAPGPSISTSPDTIPGGQTKINVYPPYVVAGVANDSLYTFTVNGRTNGGPGGTPTPAASAAPRLAGTATASLPAPWTAGTALGTSDLRGLVWGSTLVAVGASGVNGVLYSSPDGVTWTAITAPATGPLNSVGYAGIYNAVGDGGVILYSTDAITWTEPAASRTLTTNKLNAVAGGARIVAVGAGGLIITSTDGTTWIEATGSRALTTNDLYGVKSYGTSVWIAVGKNGTLLTSIDNAVTWSVATSNTVNDLKAVTFGLNATTNALVFVAVGANGTVLTSPDTVTWTAQTALGTNTLSAITSVIRGTFEASGTQFVAVGANGTIYTSIDGATWAGPQPSATASNLNGVAHSNFMYYAVGSAGVNLLAK